VYCHKVSKVGGNSVLGHPLAEPIKTSPIILADFLSCVPIYMYTPAAVVSGHPSDLSRVTV
jgi:hypothetical protein